jgi:hypothetical protein
MRDDVIASYRVALEREIVLVSDALSGPVRIAPIALGRWDAEHPGRRTRIHQPQKRRVSPGNAGCETHSFECLSTHLSSVFPPEKMRLNSPAGPCPPYAQMAARDPALSVARQGIDKSTSFRPLPPYDGEDQRPKAMSR